MLFLFYEDMKRDLPSQIEKAAHFVGKSPTREEIERMADHLAFGTMKHSGAVSKEKLQIMVNDQPTGFLRKGIVGDWKDHMDGELLNEIEKWIESNIQHFNDDFKFHYEI